MAVAGAVFAHIRKEKGGSSKMPLFGKGDEAENRFKEAKRCSDPLKKEFDLDRAIGLLEAAVMLKPHEEKYRKKLEEVNEMKKSKWHEKFLMHIDDVFLIKGRGTAVTGIVQQGIVHRGDEIRIVGHRGEKRDRVVNIEMHAKLFAHAIPGDDVGLELKKLGGEDVERGDTIEKVEA